jgi:hypothetical protein
VAATAQNSWILKIQQNYFECVRNENNKQAVRRYRSSKYQVREDIQNIVERQ